MFDFADIQLADKAEQIRAWAVERAIDRLTGTPSRPEDIVKKADEIEQYILKGLQENKTDGSE